MNTPLVSGFFEDLSSPLDSEEELELLNESQSGFFLLYKRRNAGKYSILKTLKPNYSGQLPYEEMLLKEFKIGSTLSHPNIRQYLAYFEHPELGNCVEMEWVNACTLDVWKESSRASTATRKRLLGQLLDAVSYLHLHQVVHRDLKPANILVTENGTNIKLIDFSLADSDSYCILKAAAGTPLYASKEQLEGKAGDCRSDIYSLGVILSDFVENKHQRRSVGKCLEDNPEQRYQSVEDLKKDFYPSELNRLLFLLLTLVIMLSLVGFILGSRLQEAESLYEDQTIDDIFMQATELLEEHSD